MGVITYFIPYLFLFASAVRIQSQPLPRKSFRLPGGGRTIIVLAYIGLLSTAHHRSVALSRGRRRASHLPFSIVIMTLVLLAAGVAEKSIVQAAAQQSDLRSMKRNGRDAFVQLRKTTHAPISQGCSFV